MIRYNQGAQTIRWTPVDSGALVRAVASATCQIDDLREGETSSRRSVLAVSAATLSTVSTTLSAAAGPGTAEPRRVTVADDAGIRTGGVYLLADPALAIEESFTVARINGLEIEFTRPLTRSFATSSTLVGVEIEATFPASVADDEARLQNGGGPFQATWVYTIAGVLYVSPKELWLTRYGVAPWVRFDECEMHLPGLAQVIGAAVDPRNAIRAATDDFIARLMAAGAGWERDPSYFRGNLSADLFVRKRAIVYMLRGSRSEAALLLAEKYEAEAAAHADNLLEGRPPTRTVAVDPVQDTAAAGGEQFAAGGIFARV